MRLLRLLIAGAAVGGAIVLVKRLLEGQAPVPEATGSEGPGPSAAEGGSRPAPAATSAAPGRPAGSPNGGEPTKAELYERAQELEIEGRSKMSKQELKRAIESAADDG